MKVALHVWQELDEQARNGLLRRPAQAADANCRNTVAEILDRVKRDGDRAVREYSAQFDKVALDDIRVSEEEFSAAEYDLTKQQHDAIDAAIASVQRFHEVQRAENVRIETVSGVQCERVAQPLDAVGLYVPAGTAPLPSAAIMLAVPARIAGCPTRIMCTPPTNDGCADSAVLVAAKRSGVSDIYKLGGAQAIAAMAFGTETVPSVHKIFGPGNAWVTCAKSMVSADPDGAAIDLPAGPSELLVIADHAANASFVAADLLSQAEHGSDSQVLLLTDSRQLADDVLAAITSQIERLSRSEIALAALSHSRLILVASIDEAVAVSNRYAPEHLILQCNEARALLPRIRNAGSVFVGPWSPESVGDYCSGTNHVLPTYGYARSYSGLGVDQFVRHMTIQELTRDGLEHLAETVTTLARLEGLDAHAAAVSIRLESQQ